MMRFAVGALLANSVAATPAPAVNRTAAIENIRKKFSFDRLREQLVGRFNLTSEPVHLDGGSPRKLEEEEACNIMDRLGGVIGILIGMTIMPMFAMNTNTC